MTRTRSRTVLFLLAFGLSACAAPESAEKVGEVGTGETTEPAAEKPTTFGVGDVIELGDLQITVHGVQDPLPPANEFITPAAGNRYVGVDVEVVNTTAEAQPFSALLAFEIQDAENRTYDATITDHQPSVDGELPANGGKRGLAVFEVPETTSGLKLHFSGDIFASGGAVVELGT